MFPKRVKAKDKLRSQSAGNANIDSQIPTTSNHPDTNPPSHEFTTSQSDPINPFPNPQDSLPQNPLSQLLLAGRMILPVDQAQKDEIDQLLGRPSRNPGPDPQEVVDAFRDPGRGTDAPEEEENDEDDHEGYDPVTASAYGRNSGVRGAMYNMDNLSDPFEPGSSDKDPDEDEMQEEDEEDDENAEEGEEVDPSLEPLTPENQLMDSPEPQSPETSRKRDRSVTPPSPTPSKGRRNKGKGKAEEDNDEASGNKTREYNRLKAAPSPYVVDPGVHMTPHELLAYLPNIIQTRGGLYHILAQLRDDGHENGPSAIAKVIMHAHGLTHDNFRSMISHRIKSVLDKSEGRKVGGVKKFNEVIRPTLGTTVPLVFDANPDPSMPPDDPLIYNIAAQIVNPLDDAFRGVFSDICDAAIEYDADWTLSQAPEVAVALGLAVPQPQAPAPQPQQYDNDDEDQGQDEQEDEDGQGEDEEMEEREDEDDGEGQQYPGWEFGDQHAV